MYWNRDHDSPQLLKTCNKVKLDSAVHKHIDFEQASPFWDWYSMHFFLYLIQVFKSVPLTRSGKDLRTFKLVHLELRYLFFNSIHITSILCKKVAMTNLFSSVLSNIFLCISLSITPPPPIKAAKNWFVYLCTTCGSRGVRDGRGRRGGSWTLEGTQLPETAIFSLSSTYMWAQKWAYVVLFNLNTPFLFSLSF